ncbi:MAG: short-chain fatty acyl-CoA regulator family protein [Alphaproteobacteria bacterium]|nr:short-chain fatty acyl-CoA regulator family protein [Alphaproteobacteria bacterium]
MIAAPVGSRLREARKKRRLTQTKLAELVGISVSYLNLIEHNKRSIGGALLSRLANELGLDVSQLSGQEDARLMQQLGELAAEPLIHDIPLKEKGAEAIVTREPDWARAMVRLHNVWRGANELIEALSDQLNRDPFVLEASHKILTQITAVRSLSEVLEQEDDLLPHHRHRFSSLLAEESKSLGLSARELFQFLSEREQESRPATPAGEVDDFIIDHDNYFPEIEEAATRLHSRLQHAGLIDERTLCDHLASRFSIRVEFDADFRRGPGRRPGVSHFRFDEASKHLVLNASAPNSTLRFQLARILFSLECEELLKDTVDEKTLTTEDARERGFLALARYGAGALLLPYDGFLEAAEKLRYDIQMLTVRFNASFEQVCHRLVTLRRPGASAVPFAFMRTDLAGNTSKRFSLPNLRIPRHGSACSLWAVYQAFLTPDRITPQIVQLADDRRFLIVARAITKEAGAYSEIQQVYSIMLACSASYMDRIVYGDNLSSAVTPAGISCRLCPRTNCQQRAFAQILPARAGGEA